ncbi:hypothetical protein [Microbacterium sp. SORGH_AS_0888]|uniref:hypothetical protein n=1 Tax=Microbacterium sp. SORGH_AS_0888 TaxID=3041791 RepID=UPI00278B1E71|nr:hypothetical protein [Microbacterium sp. SORGH_AS_0888]MDQ1130281.1 hypothetical protein [Microbacterium sp. SORGH_AS_0888]
MDTRWLSAPEDEVIRAMAEVKAAERPAWVPTWRRALIHINASLILWYCFVMFMSLGIRVDGVGDNHTRPEDYRDLVLILLVLVAWLVASVFLVRWATSPPSGRERVAGGRQALTAAANGFEPRPGGPRFLRRLTAQRGRDVVAHPRFVGDGAEFGNLVVRTGLHGRVEHRLYVAVTLPAPLPHLYLDALGNGRAPRNLPTSVDASQRLSLEGDFDLSFAAHAPRSYGRDALYVLTPDVMASLVDDAAAFDVEIVDDRIVFTAPQGADFSDASSWEVVDILLRGPVRRVARRAAQYRDERVAGQSPEAIARELRQAQRENRVLVSSERATVGPEGRRLATGPRSRGAWPALARLGWALAIFVLYIVPGVFAFVGIMSVIDDK